MFDWYNDITGSAHLVVYLSVVFPEFRTTGQVEEVRDWPCLCERMHLGSRLCLYDEGQLGFRSKGRLKWGMLVFRGCNLKPEGISILLQGTVTYPLPKGTFESMIFCKYMQDGRWWQQDEKLKDNWWWWEASTGWHRWKKPTENCQWQHRWLVSEDGCHFGYVPEEWETVPGVRPWPTAGPSCNAGSNEKGTRRSRCTCRPRVWEICPRRLDILVPSIRG